MQTGDRLTYHPETIAAEMAHFGSAMARAMASVKQMQGEVTTAQSRKQSGTRAGEQERLARYNSNVAQAIALLQDVDTMQLPGIP